MDPNGCVVSVEAAEADKCNNSCTDKFFDVFDFFLNGLEIKRLTTIQYLFPCDTDRDMDRFGSRRSV